MLQKQGIDTDKLSSNVACEIGGVRALWHGGSATSLHTLRTLGDQMRAYLQAQEVTEVKTCVFHWPL